MAGLNHIISREHSNGEYHMGLGHFHKHHVSQCMDQECLRAKSQNGAVEFVIVAPPRIVDHIETLNCRNNRVM